MNNRAEQFPKISIVLPTYNQADMLRGAIISILSQTCHEFELIIVDDGSTDTTPQLLQSIRDPRVRVIKQENKRLPSALNAGIQAARGKYLTWTSSDNYCAPYYLEALVGALESYPQAGMAYSAFALVDSEMRIVAFKRNQDFTLHNVYIDNPGNAAFLYRRSIQEEVGLYDPDLEGTEDWDMWIRVCEKYPSVYVPEILYYYRFHDQSMTSQKRAMILESGRKTFQKTLKRHNGDIDLHALYPSLKSCTDQSTAFFNALFDLGTSFMNACYGQKAYACQMLESALSLAPNSCEVQYNLAIAYAYAKMWEKAGVLLNQVERFSVNGIREQCAIVRRAIENRSTSDLQNVKLFSVAKAQSELFRKEKEMQLVYEYTKEIHSSERKSDETSISLPAIGNVKPQRANPILIKKTNSELNQKLALALEEERTDDALQLVEELLKEEPRNPNAHYIRAQLLYSMGDAENSYSELQQVLSINPHHAGAHNDIGVLLHEKGKLEEAYQHLQEATVLDPQTNYLYNLGMVQLQMKKPEEAYNIFKNIHEMNPDDKEVANILENIENN